MADAWVLHPDYRTPPVPTGTGVDPGPWRHPDGGQIMNGTYERPLPDHQVEVVTIWYGYALSHWRGPRMPRFSSPMVSAWNPVLAQGLAVEPGTPTPYRDALWCDRWIAEALLYGRKPYGAFTLPVEETLRWFGKSGGSGLVYHAETSGELIRVVAGTSERYAHLFDLDALIADYRDALPPELAEPEAAALEEHRGHSPALHYILSDGAEARFAQAPLSVRGLTLGYPPRETAARIAAAAALS
ncbi:hypothetical protein ITP53_21195 [Nonomuraea sp. K274]|uniref:Uncharacterized protein n=1 Tax=Nonomuraea cypriaca TaxID=1187855 RepID=A0A931ADR2_9ACTN|nr:hypothetical protein [Nonomuraea cypriaca]MBF8188200.1 hypothetical protein [Nonomuraea cypriaca]